MKAYIHEQYPRHSVGRIMIHDFLKVQNDLKISEVLQILKKDMKKSKLIDYVYVIDSDNNLLGVFSIKDVFDYPGTVRISAITRKNVISVTPDTEREIAADITIKHNIKAIPVVKKRKLLGVVSSDEILSIINRSLREDVLHFAGIHKSHLKYENTLAIPFFLNVLHRLPWLLIGLIGITASSLFIGIFKSTLENYLILAFFLPSIVYMSGAMGVQHQTLFIRDLAIMGKQLKFKSYFLRQIGIGSILGLIISLLVFLIIFLFWREPYIAMVISISMFFTIVISSCTALITTILMNKLKLDPAVGSGPLGTIISDVTSIIIYFVIASLLLGV